MVFFKLANLERLGKDYNGKSELIFAISFPDMPNSSCIHSLWIFEKQHLANSSTVLLISYYSISEISKGIPRGLQKPKVYSPVRNNPSNFPSPEPYKFNPNLYTHIKIQFNYIPIRLIPLNFPLKKPVCISLLPLRATYPAYLMFLDLSTIMIFGEE
jgi:hypothetical protein